MPEWLVSVKLDVDDSEFDLVVAKAGGCRVDRSPIPMGTNEKIVYVEADESSANKLRKSHLVTSVSPNSPAEPH